MYTPADLGKKLEGMKDKKELEIQALMADKATELRKQKEIWCKGIDKIVDRQIADGSFSSDGLVLEVSKGDYRYHHEAYEMNERDILYVQTVTEYVKQFGWKCDHSVHVERDVRDMGETEVWEAHHYFFLSPLQL